MKNIISVQSMLLLVSFFFSLQTIAMEGIDALITASSENSFSDASNWTKQDRAEHNRKHQEWVLAGAKCLQDIYSDLQKYFNVSGNEWFLINKISLYLNTYNGMKADLLLYRGSLYRTLKNNDAACEDFKMSAACACFQNFSDIKPLVEWANIRFESGEYENALYILTRAKKSSFCTQEKTLQIDADIMRCTKTISATKALALPANTPPSILYENKGYSK